MLATIILRFRDLIADTITEHQKMIDQFDYVWWGWWRKPNEPKRLPDLEELQTRVHAEPMEIGLFDRSTQKFYSAIVDNCVFGAAGKVLSTPQSESTPAYYRNEKIPAWFRLLHIKKISREVFIQQYSTVPVEDYTFYPVRLHIDTLSTDLPNVVSSVMPLHGNTIVHVSDVHFGTDFGFPPTAGPGSSPLLEVIASDIHRLAGSDIALLVVSGDLTSRGEASHLFNNAKPFLHELRARLGIAPEQVVIVPGNHDICFKEFALTYDHETAFNDFLKAFYDSPRKQVQLLRYKLPSGRMLELLTMNSVKLRTKETSNYGWVDWRACEEVLATSEVPEPNTLRVAVLHHHLVPVLRDEKLPDPDYSYGSISVTLNAGAIVEGLQSHGFRLVLHGHQHTPAINRISRARFETGTLGLKGIDEPLYVVAGGSAGIASSLIDGEIRENCYGLIKIGDTHLSVHVRQYSTSGNPRDLFLAQLAL